MESSINAVDLVVLPIVIAQSLRWSRRFATFVSARRTQLSTLCQIGILLMVMLGAVQMGNRLASTTAAATSVAAIVLVIVLCVVAHLVTLVACWYAALWTGVSRKQRIAVAFSGSQKTLMIGLKLAIDCGVSILPMVIYHVSQLVMDAMIADWWLRSEKSGKTKSAEIGQSTT